MLWDGDYSNSRFWPHSQVPRNGSATITSVAWDWHEYTNGFTTQTVEICYMQEYQYSEYLCIGVSENPTYFTNAFNGLNARATFVMRITLFGGTYPAHAAGKDADTIRVYYEY